MKLDADYRIETDANNFTLRFEKLIFDEKKGKEVKSIREWYCKSLGYALNTYLNDCLRPCENIKEVVAELNRVEELIKTIK